MQHCSTLEELSAHFEGQLSMLRECLQLHHVSHDQKAAPVLQKIQSIMSTLSADLAKMRLQINTQKRELENLHQLKESVSDIAEMTLHAQQNLPSNLPTKPVLGSIQPEQRQRLKAPPQNPATPTMIPSIQQLKKVSSSLFMPSIEYLTVQEFQSIPKYMKGRLKYDQVNDLIAQMNAAIEGKYRLMHSARAKKITEANKKRVQVMKSQENKDTRDTYFVIDADLADFGKVKLDSTLRASITILRHFSRIREIRGQGVVRYAVV